MDIVKVNKYESDWAPEALFNGLAVKIVLRDEGLIILRFSFVSQLKKVLLEQVGPENNDWMIVDRNEVTELYLRRANILVYWKMIDFDYFIAGIDRIESHLDSESSIL